METLEYIKKAEGGRIVIDIPESLEGMELKVLVMENDNNQADKIDEKTSANKVKDLMKYFGTSKYPDVDLDKFNVYEQ